MRGTNGLLVESAGEIFTRRDLNFMTIMERNRLTYESNFNCSVRFMRGNVSSRDRQKFRRVKFGPDDTGL